MLRLLFMYSSDFGERVIRNLINDPSFCKACGLLCDFCKYGLYTKVQNIHAAIELPNPRELPPFIDDPETLLPKTIPAVDICIAIDLHQDILLTLPSLLSRVEISGLLIPIEDFRVVPPGLEKQVIRECGNRSIEVAFPKPFCSLESVSTTPLISRFVEEFHIGKPVLQITTQTFHSIETIRGVTVERSAPCGSTWYVARKLLGNEVEREHLRDVIAKAHHSYPCTATMSTDPELGEPLLHKAGYTIREAVEKQLF